MKRLFSLLLFAALLCALALSAWADVAYMPQDSFLEKHWKECQSLGRAYYTNGAEGYVLAHKTPDSAEATPLPNGGLYFISSVYQGRWGVLEYHPDTLENFQAAGSVSGWVDMDEMLADYDQTAFAEDHGREFRYDPVTVDFDSDVVYTYKYPGSGVVEIELQGQFLRESITFNTLFTDPAGRLWGCCSYHYGLRDFWICLDDPSNGALEPDENCVTITTRPAAAAPAADETPAPSPDEAPAPTAAPGKTVELTPAADGDTLQQAAKAHSGSGSYLAAGAGGVVIVAAAVLIAALRKKRR